MSETVKKRNLQNLAECGVCRYLVFTPHIHKDDRSLTGWLCDKCAHALDELKQIKSQK